MQPTDQNPLAYSLHRELLDTAEHFMVAHPDAKLEAILGAGNLYITGWLVSAPTKGHAIATLDDCCRVMRQVIDFTPDHFFGGKIYPQNPTLN